MLELAMAAANILVLIERKLPDAIVSDVVEDDERHHRETIASRGPSHRREYARVASPKPSIQDRSHRRNGSRPSVARGGKLGTSFSNPPTKRPTCSRD